MTVREQTEEIERQTLSPYASFSCDTKGREKEEAECPLRTAYQRDRDRIIHCKAFRRLKQKTQVFLSPEGDHYRTRLTHTLEVSQIARTIARALRLNEDLTEAIALGHDLGHTPFGHAGERALAKICPGGFRHNWESVRIVELYEKEGAGLNLTWEVRDGIFYHSSGEGGLAHTREGQIVKFADRIAYTNHDLDDAARAGILREQDLPYTVQVGLGRNKSARISTLIGAIVENGSEEICMTPEIHRLYDELYQFMYFNLYTNEIAKKEENKVQDIIYKVYDHYIHHLEELPTEYKLALDTEGDQKVTCDYIAGMTDRYIIDIYKDLFLPQSWNRF